MTPTSLAPSPSPSPLATSRTPKKNRCYTCKKKVGLTGLSIDGREGKNEFIVVSLLQDLLVDVVISFVLFIAMPTRTSVPMTTRRQAVKNWRNSTPRLWLQKLTSCDCCQKQISPFAAREACCLLHVPQQLAVFFKFFLCMYLAVCTCKHLIQHVLALIMA